MQNSESGVESSSYEETESDTEGPEALNLTPRDDFDGLTAYERSQLER